MNAEKQSIQIFIEKGKNTMLKTNSKKARENVQEYIMNNFDGSGYDIQQPETFKETAEIIYNTFLAEHWNSENIKRYYHFNRFASFCDWCSGLPSILDCCYYYNRSAVDDVAGILEETEAEKARYTERKAEELLTLLIYRELEKAAA